MFYHNLAVFGLYKIQSKKNSWFQDKFICPDSHKKTFWYSSRNWTNNLQSYLFHFLSSFISECGLRSYRPTYSNFILEELQFLRWYRLGARPSVWGVYLWSLIPTLSIILVFDNPYLTPNSLYLLSFYPIHTFTLYFSQTSKYFIILYKYS